MATKMKTLEKQLPEDVEEIEVEDICPLIEIFFERMTSEQWELLKTGAADNATKVNLAELILNLISLVTRAMLTFTRNTNVPMSEEVVLSRLGDTPCQAFAEVLDVNDEVECVSSKKLNHLIVKEITLSINSAINSNISVDTLKRITPPYRLNMMVGHACIMLKSIIGKMTGLCTPRPRRPASQDIPISITDVPLDRSDQELARRDSCQSAARSVGSESLGKVSRKSKDSNVVAETSKLVQEIIRKELNEMAEPILDDMSDQEYELLESGSSLEIQKLSDGIAEVILEEAKSSEAKDAASAIPSPTKPKPLSVGVWRKLKAFFAAQFAKLSIYRMLAQLRAKFCSKSKAKSPKSLQSFVDEVDDLLLTAGARQDGNQVLTYRRLDNIANGNVLVFSKALSDLLYIHTSEGVIPDVIPQRVREPMTASAPHDALHDDIRGKVWCFMGMVRWWLSTQAGSHSEMVTLALKQTESVIPTISVAVSDETDATQLQEEKSKAEYFKMSVKVLVHQVVSELFSKADVNIKFVDPLVIHEHLFAKVWAEVEGLDVEITTKTFERLPKAILRDLRKKWNYTAMVLVALNQGEPSVGNYIAMSFRYHLTTGLRKRSALCKFFSTVGRAICRPFRRRQSTVIGNTTFTA